MSKKRLNKKKVLLITPGMFPVPAVSGGAVETLITNLLDVNEKQKKVSFILTSVFDKKAAVKKYHDSKIYYFKNGILKNHKVFFCFVLFAGSFFV